MILSELAPAVNAQQGVFYIMIGAAEEPVLKLLASYAYRERKTSAIASGSAKASSARRRSRRSASCSTNVPEDYVQISSGLGEATPLNIIVLPVLFEGQVKAVMELSSFERFSPTHQAFLDQLVESIGIVLNTIEANTLTEDLLKQSQSLATRTAEPAAGTAEDQRGTGGKGAAARRAERGGRAEEPRSGAGPPGAGRKGDAALAHLQVQERVPGEHVARAAHAAEQLAHSCRSARDQPRGQLTREAGRVRRRRSTARARICSR